MDKEQDRRLGVSPLLTVAARAKARYVHSQLLSQAILTYTVHSH